MVEARYLVGYSYISTEFGFATFDDDENLPAADSRVSGFNFNTTVNLSVENHADFSISSGFFDVAKLPRYSSLDVRQRHISGSVTAFHKFKDTFVPFIRIKYQALGQWWDVDPSNLSIAPASSNLAKVPTGHKRTSNLRGPDALHFLAPGIGFQYESELFYVSAFALRAFTVGEQSVALFDKWWMGGCGAGLFINDWFSVDMSLEHTGLHKYTRANVGVTFRMPSITKDNPRNDDSS